MESPRRMLGIFVGRQPGSREEGWQRALVAALAAILGCLHWGGLLRWGDLPWGVEDWPRERLYLNVLGAAVRQGVVPWRIDVPVQGTQDFIAIPETLALPHVLLLGSMPIGKFVVVHVLGCFLAGWLGCCVLAWRHRLSPLAAAATFLLLLFHGHVVSHLAVGHFMWTGCLLLPWFVAANLEMAAGGAGRLHWSAAVALVLFAMLLLGSFHLVTWCALFLALQIPTAGRAAVAALALAFGAGAVRYLPAAAAMSGKQHLFVTGYPSLRHVWDGLTALRGPSEPPFDSAFGKVSWWEFDLFIDGAGALFLALCGVWWRCRRPHGRHPLDAPMLALALLSLSGLYAPIAYLPIPLFNAERISSRFLVVPMVFLAVLAAKELSARGPTAFRSDLAALLAAGLLLHAAWAFGQHSWQWRMESVEKSPFAMGQPATAAILPSSDPKLRLAFGIGGGISAVAVAIAMAAIIRQPRINADAAP